MTTLDQFVEWLETVPGPWHLGEEDGNSGLIRHEQEDGCGYCKCPVTAVAHHHHRLSEIHNQMDMEEFADELNMDVDDVREIVSAADGDGGHDHEGEPVPYDEALRKRLLKATGLAAGDGEAA